MLHLTPVLLEATYERLRLTQPFKKWKLPHADELEFRVTRHKSVYGSFHFDDKGKGWPKILVSTVVTRTLSKLDEVMAHEMCHLREIQLSLSRASVANHGKQFLRLARDICRYHEFDLKTF